MTDINPFVTMCNIFGVDIAIQKAKMLGIPVSQEEIDRQRRKEEEILKVWADLANALTGVEQDD